MMRVSPFSVSALPNQIGVTAVHTARLCTFRAFQQLARDVAGSPVAPSLIPRHRAALTGEVRHRAAQLRASGVEEEEATIASEAWVRGRIDSSVDRRWLHLFGVREMPETAHRRGAVFSPDIELRVEGGPEDCIVGKIDRVERSSDGVVLFDLKTGSLLDREGGPRAEYVEQLQLYAAIWPAHQEGRVNRLFLEPDGIEGARIEVCLPSDPDALMNEAHSLLRKVQDSADNAAAAATPSPEACRGCGYRPRCPGYLQGNGVEAWTAAERTAPPPGFEIEWPRDLIGEVLEVQRFGVGGGASATIGLILQAESGVVRVRNLTPEMFGDGSEPMTDEEITSALPGNRVGVFEVASDVPGSDSWVSSEQTVVYQLE